MSEQKCTQPGCPGSVVDGYCDYCGMPPGAAKISIETPEPMPLRAPTRKTVSTPNKASPRQSGPMGVSTGPCPQS